MKTEITLDYPVEMKGETIGCLNIRRMKARDQVAVAKLGVSDAEQEIRLFANLCEVSPDVIEDLDMKDYRKLQATYKSFLS